MDWLLAAGILVLMGALASGVRLVREGRRQAGLTLSGLAILVGGILAAFGSWAPILYMLAGTALFSGVEMDRPGHPVRRALALLGIAIWFVALVIAGQYM